MDPVSISDVVEAVGGRWLGAHAPPAEPILEVSTDSRAVSPGALFVPLKGQRFDGRKFVVEALGRGARAAFVDRGGSVLCPPGAPLIEVENPLAALERLA